MVSDNLQMWAIGAGVTVLLGLITRIAKKNKWADRCEMFGVRLGQLISAALLGWLPAKVVEKAEEGFVVTALKWVSRFLRGVETGLLMDNEMKLNKTAKKEGR